MKKVGIVSCYFQPNYGSMLQAFATQKNLDNWGIPNETICIDGFAGEIRAAKIKYFRGRIFSPDVIKDKMGFVKLALEKRLRGNTLGKDIAIRNGKFKRFAKKNFHLSRPYQSIEELGLHAYEYSAFLVGSDQLWLPSNIAANYYTLDFVPDHVRKIAYATSFGVSELPAKQEAAAVKFLRRIDDLSVREQSGQKLVKKITGLDIPVVCDPTLLLTAGDWSSIQREDRLIKEPYIFCYLLGSNPYPRQFARELKAKTGLKIVALQQLDAYIKSDAGFADVAPYDVDPSDFIDLIGHAEYICTDSFHGTVFSILKHKTFFTFHRFRSKSSMSTNSRIDSLLNVLNLESRLVQDGSNVDAALAETIPYAMVEERMSDFRSDSQRFFRNALLGLK